MIFTISPQPITTVKATISGLVRNRATGLFGGTITLTNTGSTTWTGQLQVVLSNLPTGVTLANAAGTTSSGNPYLLVNLPAGGLAPGHSVTFVVSFSNPKLLSFQDVLTVFDDGSNDP